MAARIDEETLKVGLLMEAAQAQQALAATTLDRLREHTAGLDEIVRAEIRATLIEEMRALGEDIQCTTVALRRLQRIANLRLVVWGTAVLGMAALIPGALAWWLLPTHVELEALTAKRDELSANLAKLSRQGGHVELRQCGDEQRLCVRIERAAPAYGTAGDYRVVKGY